LPSNLVQTTLAFEEKDYRLDDSVISLDFMINEVHDKDLKKWLWYSSKLNAEGFDVYFEGFFRLRFTRLLRFLGVPASKVSIVRKGIEHNIKLRNDVIVYKNLEAY
jgi:hypothetical protein